MNKTANFINFYLKKGFKTDEKKTNPFLLKQINQDFD
jgi:hypothetical protein